MNRRTLIITGLLALPGAALAQGQPHAHTHAPGPNGGTIGEVGTRHVELVVQAGELRIYVLDEQDRPTSARGATGSVVVQAQGRQQTVRLEPGAGDAYLVGRGDIPARGLRVVATLTLPGQPQRSVRFAAIP
ncbi:hypothetical protein KTR66_05490 [Roseococcus sp. SDR]|uniref:hypothetical protein n=1 Tax=Roseococcus sp. SDR TaxID=2835532 RepID=UPI001BCBAADA|nr:hypothetical protein [Roseococcus sp. SDR]MBS7789436.1 hypothetical protein [Roseococcus sp. SDR]MBV1844750.1 hypothetical protein [Roseococcus sp. SDR]